MALEPQIQRLAEFTLCKVVGPASMDDFAALIVAMGEATRKAGDKRVLVDLLGVEGEMKFTDHFQIGQMVAQHMRHLDRLASVVPEEKITRTSEKVAVKQGMQLRVFTSMNEAIRWLGEGLESTAARTGSGLKSGA
jgi:hypothetical protein